MHLNPVQAHFSCIFVGIDFDNDKQIKIHFIRLIYYHWKQTVNLIEQTEKSKCQNYRGKSIYDNKICIYTRLK